MQSIGPGGRRPPSCCSGLRCSASVESPLQRIVASWHFPSSDFSRLLAACFISSSVSVVHVVAVALVWLSTRLEISFQFHLIFAFVRSAAYHWTRHLMQRNGSNQAMQPTPKAFASRHAGRRTVSLYFMKTRPLQATLALASGG
jgi:hypothetical protein